MRLSLRLQRRSTVVILVLMIILGILMAVKKQGLISTPVFPLTIVSAAYSEEDIIVVHPPPPGTHYGAHNFRRLNHVITEYDNDVVSRLAILVERRSTAADQDLIRLIVDMLDPPSNHMVKMSRQLFSTPQSREVDKILRRKVGLRMRDNP